MRIHPINTSLYKEFVPSDWIESDDSISKVLNIGGTLLPAEDIISR